MAECCGESREGVDAAIERLRREFADKHRENKVEIERLKSGQDLLRRDLQHLEGRIDPYLDNGQPGLFSRMSDKLDRVLDLVNLMQVENAKDNGEREANLGWLTHWLGPLAVGIALILLQHFWK